MSFLLLLISTLQWNWRKAQNMFCLEGTGEVGRGWRQRQEREMTQTMYAQVNKVIIKKSFGSNMLENNL
jgi:hypothetical protein